MATRIIAGAAIALFMAMPHLMGDSENPARIVRAFRRGMAPGSYLVLSHLTTDEPLRDAVARTVQVYGRARPRLSELAPKGVGVDAVHHR